MTDKKVNFNRERRKRKIRTRIKAYSGGKLRLSVFRSNKHFYAQLIDIKSGKTIFALSDMKLKDNQKEKFSEKIKRLGTEFGKKMLEKGVHEAVFDRSFYKFHGLVKNFVQGVKEAGIKI